LQHFKKQIKVFRVNFTKLIGCTLITKIMKLCNMDYKIKVFRVNFFWISLKLLFYGRLGFKAFISTSFIKLNLLFQDWEEVRRKVMRSMNIIKYLIKNQVQRNILQKYSSDYHAIFSVFLNIAKMAVFCRNLNITELFLGK